MKKILIVYKEALLKKTGGPCGYLYNLNKGLQTLDDREIVISFLTGGDVSKNIKQFARNSKNKVVKFFLDAYRRIRHIFMTLSVFVNHKKFDFDISQFDAIHFHNTKELFLHRKELEHYSGKIILTSHSPQPASIEYIESSSKIELFLFGWKYKQLIEMDRFSFNRANYIFFPCEYADEPYMHAWKEYEMIKKNKQASYRYILSGSVKADAKESRNIIRDRYRIPKDAFVISYVGRHNEVKGYDRIKEMAPSILDENTYILIAGNEGPLYGLKKDHWIEVGWTNDPHSIIAASDVFVLPNRETYFDLVLLEVMSLGTYIIASNTGGNKYFKGFEGVTLFDTNQDCIDIINNCKTWDIERYKEICNLNKKKFDDEFTTDIFAKNYIELIKEILQE